MLNLGVGRGNIPHRIFEALACGSFLLTNDLPVGKELFRDRVHLAYYNDDNIEELIEYYLAHHEEREHIAAQGRVEVLSKHTVSHRLQRVMQDAFSACAADIQLNLSTPVEDGFSGRVDGAPLCGPD